MDGGGGWADEKTHLIVAQDRPPVLELLGLGTRQVIVLWVDPREFQVVGLQGVHARASKPAIMWMGAGRGWGVRKKTHLIVDRARPRRCATQELAKVLVVLKDSAAHKLQATG